MGVFASFFSRTFKWTVKLLVYDVSAFFVKVLRIMRFPLCTAFNVSHNLEMFCLYSHWIIKSLMSLILLCPCYWVKSSSASMGIWTFCCFCCYWIPAVVHCSSIESMRLIPCPWIYSGLFCVWKSNFEKVPIYFLMDHFLIFYVFFTLPNSQRIFCMFWKNLTLNFR